jgi:Predicted transcriptional regulator
MSFKDRPYFRRILELDDVLRQGKKVTATTLAERWETSTKTVQRLIENLRNEFRAPLEWDARKGTYVYTDPGWHLPWLAMEGADLFAVGVAMKVLQLYEGTPAAKDLKAIYEKLSKLMPRRSASRPRRSSRSSTSARRRSVPSTRRSGTRSRRRSARRSR